MDLHIQQLIDRIVDMHRARILNNRPNRIAAEERLGVELPIDMRTFYDRFDGVKLFGRYQFLATAHLAYINELYEASTIISRSWIAFCYLDDGDYAVLVPACARIVECDHERFFDDPAECEIIADSFTVFVEKVLNSGGRMLQ